jgi:hypothetical protein
MKSHAVSISIAVLTGCGAPAETRDAPAADTTAPLYGATSHCGERAGAGGILTSIQSLAFNVATEQDLSARSPLCDAWVVNYRWDSVPVSRQWFSMFPRDFPTDQAGCQHVWMSNKIYGDWPTGFLVLHDQDTPLRWENNRCVNDQSSHLPSQPFWMGANLRFSGSSGYDAIGSYPLVRVVNQSLFAFWAVPGQVVQSIVGVPGPLGR